MSRWIERLNSEKHGGRVLPKLPKATFVSFSSGSPQRKTENERLIRLARMAECPPDLIQRMHTHEVGAYARYRDADVVASLAHLAACPECQARQTRLPKPTS